VVYLFIIRRLKVNFGINTNIGAVL